MSGEVEAGVDRGVTPAARHRRSMMGKKDRRAITPRTLLRHIEEYIDSTNLNTDSDYISTLIDYIESDIVAEATGRPRTVQQVAENLTD